MATNNTEQNEWENGLCETDCGNCMASWFCHPFAFGRSHERMKYFPSTDKEDFSLFNGSCMVQYGASCFHLGWVPLLLQRMEMRKMFGIKGDGCTDCLASYFCCCCTISQMNREMKKRAEMAQAQPVGGHVNMQPQPHGGGMVYGQQQQPQGEMATKYEQLLPQNAKHPGSPPEY